MRTTRRGILRGAAGVLALGAGGCGFQPIYGRGGASGGDPAVAQELASVRVPRIPERFGQLMRRNLEQRLVAGTGTPAPARWELQVAPVLQAEAVGVLRSGEATRVRYIGTANWSLLRLTPRETIANGFERAIDAFNIEQSQFFAADQSRDAAERRLAEQLAQEVVTRLAMRFRGMQEGQPAPALIEPVQVPPPLPGTASPLPGVGGGLLDSGPRDALGGGLGGGLGPLGVPR